MEKKGILKCSLVSLFNNNYLTISKFRMLRKTKAIKSDYVMTIQPNQSDLDKDRDSNSQKTTKNLFGQIFLNKPNCLTYTRLLLNFAAGILFEEFVQLSSVLINISVILDYFDGHLARRYNECSFFGELMDWTADFSAYAIILFQIIQMEQNLTWLWLLLLHLQLLMMIIDITSKASGYAPRIIQNQWSTLVLKLIMDENKRGYTPTGFFGYWCQIFHHVGLTAVIFYFKTKSLFWLQIVMVNLPFCFAYVVMNSAYTFNLLSIWNQSEESEMKKVKFIEK